MKKTIALLVCALLLAGCAAEPALPTAAEPSVMAEETPEVNFLSRFDSETAIVLSDEGITVNGGEETDTVYTSRDIIYYEDKDAYESGNPYGEGTDADKHTAEEAQAHTVVNITAPGAYRVSGSLSAGQLRIDLGEDAYDNPDAVVELILDNADITCTVAPAILFLNTYECDGAWSTETAKAEVDTTAAGANLILEGENTVSGSYVARIYKDKEGEKKLWKQDGAIYSYMSLNVYGPGALDLTAANEGLDTELHLTINGGDIAIRSDNDGINTNEDGVSVTTINAGTLHIIAGLGAEGDGIDSNGYLVINGGTVIAAANPGADAGMDSDMGSFIHGGTVIALGSTMDWAESNSEQVTMNLQFAQYQSGGNTISITTEDGTAVFACDLGADTVLGENVRRYTGMILSSPNLIQGERYHVYLDGVRQAYSGTDVAMGPGGMGGFGGKGPEGGREGMTPPELPEGETMPADRTPGGRGEMPGGFGGEMPENFTLPEGETMPEDWTPGMPGEMPAMPEGETMPDGGFRGGRGESGWNPGGMTGESNTVFYMQDKVNCFSGIRGAAE